MKSASTSSRKLLALAYGIVCHGSFLISVSMMWCSLYFGLTSQTPGSPVGFFRDSIPGRLIESYGNWGLLSWNFILALSYPLTHTFLLTPKGRKIMSWLAPGDVSKQLISTIFVTLTSLHLALVFVLWLPTDIVWSFPGVHSLLLWSALYAASWLLLGKSMYDSGLSLQIGSLGWLAVFCGRQPEYPGFKEKGFYRFCRQPIYLSFALILLLAPVWTPDHLILATVWTLYCLIGPLYKEKRFIKMYGDSFRDYQSRVPYWIPFLNWKI